MKTKQIAINVMLGAAFAAVTFFFWAMTNRPSSEPPWPSSVAGMSFSPLHIGHDPANGIYPTVEEIEQDVALLAGKVKSIRTYGVEATLAEVPTVARKYNMTVTLGAWLSDIPEKNDEQVTRLIEVAKANRDVVKRVIVGNEVLLRGELTLREVVVYLDRVRAALKGTGILVSTGEPWGVWIAHPWVTRHVDFIAAHFLPYWEGLALDKALDHVEMGYRLLREKFPTLPVLMAEVGWPSNGRTRRSAVASEANEAIFLRRFLQLAKTNHYDYYLMEAFDQTWKKESEGSVGAYWGVFNVFREPKFAFTEPVVRMPNWRILATFSILVALMTFTILLRDGQGLKKRGKTFLAIVSNGLGVAVVWAVYDYANQYLTVQSIIIGIVMALGILGIALVLLTEAHEWVEACWARRRRGIPVPAGWMPAFRMKKWPRVSIHVPAYNEPPEMLKETLNALSRLDYPDFEVLVIDNNTKDPNVWQPVAEHCQLLGDRFRFFHVDPLPGFKAGALNYAIRHTDPKAEVIAVIDSDYQVTPSWLRDLVPCFGKPEVGLVQGPQDYRDGEENLFKSMCYAEYQGFFHIGMVTRNDRNAIIEHGTMTMIRASVLREVGGWAEWCITEDAELGLRIFEKGHEAVYVNRSYGKGLIPDTFVDYKKQRYRWAYGAIQILKRHARALRGQETQLTAGQRYHFLAGWLPWLADGLNLFYTMGAIVWSVLMIVNPKYVDPPLTLFMAPPVMLFVFKVAKLVFLYRTQVGISRFRTLGAAMSGLALSHTIAKAVVSGVFTSGAAFFRTPKCENSPKIVQALAAALEETALAVVLWICAAGVYIVQGPDIPGAVRWSGVLLVQSLPYLAAMVVAMINALPAKRASESAVAAPKPISADFRETVKEAA